MLTDNTTQNHTILVRCPNWAGDVVMATPVLRCLRENYPESRIVAGVRGYAQGILRDSPFVDEVFPCDDKTVKGFRQTVRRMKEFAPDLAVILPNSFRSWLEVRLACPGEIQGYRRGVRKLFMPRGLEPKRVNGRIPPMPMVTYYLNICRDMGLAIPEDSRPELGISDQLQAEGDAILKDAEVDTEKRVIGLNPGASFGSSKCWPVANFARLAEMIEEAWDCTILLFGSPGEVPLTREITAQSNASIINTAPMHIDLEYLKPLINRCDLLVTNDTGPRHYAVALDIPVVVIMGPTNPGYTAANLEKTTVVREDVECGPCHKKVCPRDHRCMTWIKPETVFDAAEKLLEGAGE